MRMLFYLNLLSNNNSIPWIFLIDSSTRIFLNRFLGRRGALCKGIRGWTISRGNEMLLPLLNWPKDICIHLQLNICMWAMWSAMCGSLAVFQPQWWTTTVKAPLHKWPLVPLHYCRHNFIGWKKVQNYFALTRLLAPDIELFTEVALA